MKRLLGIALICLLAVSAYGERRREISRSVPAPASKRIDISGFNSSEITYRVWDKSEVSIHVVIMVELSEPNDEQRVVDAFDLAVNEGGNAIAIELKQPDYSGHGSFMGWLRSLFGSHYRKQSISGEIMLPRANDLSCRSSFGTLELDGLTGSVDIFGQSNKMTLTNCSNLRQIKNNFGTTEIRRSGGSLDFDGSSSHVTIEDFNGQARISAPFSTMKMTRIGKSLTVNSSSGKLTITEVKGDLEVNAPFSTISATDIAGFARIDTKSGRVTLRTVDGASVEAPFSNIEITALAGKSKQECRVSSQSGTIALNDIKANCTIDAPFSRIDLQHIAGSVSVQGTSTTTTALDIRGDWKSRTQFGNVRVKELYAQTVDIQSKSGSVTLECALSPKRLEVVNEFAGIDIETPHDITGSFTMEVEYGSIETNLPIHSKKLSSAAYATGSIGSPENVIRVETRSGNIRFNRR